MIRARRIGVLVIALACASAPLTAQRIDWTLRATLYGDNTEFFTPYRTGQTVLGGQVATWLGAAATDRVTLRVGAFADRRWGSEAFTDSLKPILSARYETTHGLGVIGTLETVRRHGLLDPVMISLREVTSPVEYGLQWRERRTWLDAEAWINWQQLNTPEQREGFEVGGVVAARATPWLTLEAQHLWSHRGGQLYDAGVPVTNNRVTAVGVGVADSVRFVRHARIQAFGIWSEGHLDPDYPSDRPSGGHGLWIRGEVNPWPHWSLFAIHWRGTDFDAAAGDPNYGSVGLAPGFYRAERRYWELGVMRRVGIADEGVSFDTEARLHRIDDEDSVAFFGTPWELSYRIILRVPVAAVLRGSE